MESKCTFHFDKDADQKALDKEKTTCTTDYKQDNLISSANSAEHLANTKKNLKTTWIT